MKSKKRDPIRLTRQGDMVRACGAIIPATLFTAFLKPGLGIAAASAAIGWGVSFYSGRVRKFRRFSYALIVALSSCYPLSVFSTAARMEAPLMHLRHLLLDASLFSLPFLGLILPAWVLAFLTDIGLCSWLEKRK